MREGGVEGHRLSYGLSSPFIQKIAPKVKPCKGGVEGQSLSLSPALRRRGRSSRVRTVSRASGIEVLTNPLAGPLTGSLTKPLAASGFVQRTR